MKPDDKRELEEFLYIVSHDFNAPLRHIREFSKLLIKSLEERLQENEKEYVAYLQNSVKRAEQMLEALLRLSRLNTQKQPVREIACKDLIAEIIEDLEDGDLISPDLQYETLPETITAEPHHIRILFEELISNAIKFRRAEASPNIKITAKRKKDEWCFCMEDNGIGIPENLTQKVFQIFHRIDPASEASGIGAGLTIAQKIVQDHGGEIWIESIENEKTKVFFTLPS